MNFQKNQRIFITFKMAKINENLIKNAIFAVF